MQIVHSLDTRITDRPVILTMGKFDGLHIGHQQLIKATTGHARRNDFLAAVLTWEPHPYAVLRPDQPLQLLTSSAEREALIAAMGADLLIVAPFTAETMRTPAADYMRQICTALPLRELWVGEDFAMGRGREGNLARLIELGQELGYAVGSVSRILVDGEPVSASRVRSCLREGAVERVVPLLGRRYSVEGVVVEGDHRGRQIGFPTANLALHASKVLPADGVYACTAELDDGTSQPAVTNIGVRPTFGGLQRTVEAYLLDWAGDLYGRTLRLAFAQRLRGEQKFSGIDALVAQIRRDVAHAREVLVTSGE